MKISPARRAALTLLHEDRWLREPDWDLLCEAIIREQKLEDARDRRLFTQLAAGTVRLLGRLDARMKRLVGKRRLDPAVRTALRLALFQLDELDRLPAHAVVGESVQYVKERRGQKLAGWTNANLRRYLREGLPGDEPDAAADPVAFGVQQLSYPSWLVRRWLEELGQERAFAVMDAMNGRGGISFRWNRRRPGLDEFLAGLGDRPVHRFEELPGAFRVEGAVPEEIWRALDEGLLSVQDESSQHAALLTAAAGPGRWLDLCAAPGGKTGQLAELAGEGTEILALDSSAERLEKVVANLDRLGLSGVEIRRADLLADEIPPAEAMLLDAPCSALGVLAENPDARWRKGPDQIAPLAARQAEMLRRAAEALRPGGTLIYSVCTLTPEETTERRAALLAERPDMKIDPLRPGEPGASRARPEGDLILWPRRQSGAGGYLVRFRKDA